MSPQLVEIEFSKFQIDFSTSLNIGLWNIGMVLPFSNVFGFFGIVDDPIFI